MRSQTEEDNEFDLCFVVEEIEFLTFKHGFVQHSPYLRELLESISVNQAPNQTRIIPQIRVLLPLWATAKSFRVLLDFVSSSLPFSEMSILDKDMTNIQNVLWLSDFFQILPLQRVCIEKHILPRLSSDFTIVIPFLEDAFTKLASCQQALAEGSTDLEYLHLCEDMWYDFFSKCLDICAGGLEELIKNPAREKELFTLPEAVMEEVISRACKSLYH